MIDLFPFRKKIFLINRKINIEIIEIKKKFNMNNSNNRFQNTRQTRPPLFQNNQQQQQNPFNHQQHQLNPRAPQFLPHPPSPHFNGGTWTTHQPLPPPGFHQHPAMTAPPPNHFHPPRPNQQQQQWNQHQITNQQNRQPTPGTPNQQRHFERPPSQQQTPNFIQRPLQPQIPANFSAQNLPPFMMPPPPSFNSQSIAPPFRLPPPNSFSSMNNPQFRPNLFQSRPQSPNGGPPLTPTFNHHQQQDRVLDEKEIYKEKMGDKVNCWLKGKSFGDANHDSDKLLKVCCPCDYISNPIVLYLYCVLEPMSHVSISTTGNNSQQPLGDSCPLFLRHWSQLAIQYLLKIDWVFVVSRLPVPLLLKDFVKDKSSPLLSFWKVDWIFVCLRFSYTTTNR